MDEEFNLNKKIEDWFNNLAKFRNTEVRQIYKINKKQLDEIHKEFIEICEKDFLKDPFKDGEPAYEWATKIVKKRAAESE